ncbi:hypothetical protein, partial [Mesorhizobium sp.]|uniref:hypothetical protein n=1 Tax=Mesorhizobium sp. TaxID=1871066 RepID=UPI00257E53EF
MMWEALMMLRLLTSLGSPLPIRSGAGARQKILSKQAVGGEAQPDRPFQRLLRQDLLPGTGAGAYRQGR